MNTDVEAVIFDMDGVIADTEKLHAEAGIDAIQKELPDFAYTPEQYSNRFAGVPNNEIHSVIFSEWGRPMTDELLCALSEHKKQKFSELFHKGIAPVPGATDLIQECVSERIPIAVGSGSSASQIDAVLRELNVAKFFRVTVGSDEVEKGKPHPETYLTAAQKLGVNIHNSVVIEDGMNGMKAGKDAGAKVIGFVSDVKKIQHEQGELVLPADLIITDLRLLTLATIRQLVRERQANC